MDYGSYPSEVQNVRPQFGHMGGISPTCSAQALRIPNEPVIFGPGYAQIIPSDTLSDSSAARTCWVLVGNHVTPTSWPLGSDDGGTDDALLSQGNLRHVQHDFSGPKSCVLCDG